MTDTTTTDAPKAKRQMTFSVLDDGTVRADFPDSGLEPFVFAPSAIPEACYADAVTDGVIYRMRSGMGRLTGDARTAEAMRASLVETWGHLAVGNWKVARASADSATHVTIEVEAAWVFRQKRAVAAGKDISEAGTLAQAAENYAALSEEQVAKLKANPLYQLARAEVKAARDAEKLAKLAKKAAESEDDSGF